MTTHRGAVRVRRLRNTWARRLGRSKWQSAAMWRSYFNEFSGSLPLKSWLPLYGRVHVRRVPRRA